MEDLYWERAWRTQELERLKKLLRDRPFDKPQLLELFRGHGVHSICDAGCGFGFYASHFARAGFAVSGLDVSESSVRLTQKLMQQQELLCGEFAAAPVTEIPFADARFDATFCNSVIDHMTLSDAKRAIGELERITKQGGLLYLSFDIMDEDDQAMPHELLPDGSFYYTQGRRNGMILYPHSMQTVRQLLEDRAFLFLREHNGQIEALYQNGTAKPQKMERREASC